MAGLLITDPVSLTQALASSNIIPGDTLVLRGGTYNANKAGAISGSNNSGKGVFQIPFVGSAGNPITIKPYPGEAVRINGGLEITGTAGYITIQDLEIGPTPTERDFANRASVDFPHGIYISVPGCRILRNYIHDGYEGMAVYGTDGIEIYGNWITHNGFHTQDDNEWHGVGIYTHNHNGGQMTIKHNIFGPTGQGAGPHLWSAGANNVKDYDVLENLLAYAGINAGCEAGTLDNILIDGNWGIVDSSRILLVDNASNGDISVSNNYYFSAVGEAVWLNYLLDGDIVDNTLIAEAVTAATTYYKSSSFGAGTKVIDRNTWHHNKASPFLNGDLTPATMISFAAWQALGFDAAGSYTQALPAANVQFAKAFTEISAEMTRVGFVGFFNWEDLASIDLDLSSLSLTNGDYLLRNAANPAQTYAFTYSGAAVAIDPDGWTISPFVGYATPLYPEQSPRFGAFIIEKD